MLNFGAMKSLEKLCYVCKQVKSVELFSYANNSTGEDNRAAYCMDCSSRLTPREKTAIVTKLWRIRHRERHVKAHKNQSLIKAYGISYEEYEILLQNQSGVCAVCGEPPSSITAKTGETRALCVDHDHQTRKVRALLCHSCNTLLGHIEANPQRIQLLLTYLKEHKEI